MNILAITPSTEREVPTGQPLALAVDSTDIEGLVAIKDSKHADILLIRTQNRSVALVVPDRTALISINGDVVQGGLCLASANAVVQILGTHSCRFGLLFDDAVQDVPIGSTCDVCGKILQEPGKAHCRHTCCTNCLDVFGNTCPDCGRGLTDASDEPSAAESLRQYLVSV